MELFKKINWQGRLLLDKIELFSFFLIYTLILIVPILVGTEGIIWVIFGIFIYIVIFIAIQQRILRYMSDRYNGMIIMGGWIEEEEGMGEPYEFRIKSFVVLKELTTEEQKTVQLYMEHQKQELNEFERAISMTQKTLDYRYIDKEDDDAEKHVKNAYYDSNKLEDKSKSNEEDKEILEGEIENDEE